MRTLALGLFLLSSLFASADAVWNVRDFGAIGDGVTLDTRAIQEAIDRCHAGGGGRVYLAGGRFVSGTIYLKSHVSLHVEAGAVLLGSPNLEHYPSTPSKHRAYAGDFVTEKMLIYAEDATNISIVGRGTIDGRGDQWVAGPYGFPSFSVRPRIIHFRGCENIQVRDITLTNSASWVQFYQSCRDLVIDGITVESRENKDIDKPRYADAPGRNTDGLDLVDCERVRISNCFINSGDDAICLKSFSPDGLCRDITITNCVISSNASAIKIGTESSGAFEDITIQNCVIYDTRAEGIALLTVDGARLERVIVSNITMRNIKGKAIQVRLGARQRRYRPELEPKKGILRDIVISQVVGTGISDIGSSLSGLPDLIMENITLRDINLTFTGGGTAEDAVRVVPEAPEAYPGRTMFGKLPAYGLYIRHARNVVLDNVRLDFSGTELRPAVMTDDVDGLRIEGLNARTAPGVEPVRLVQSRQVGDTSRSDR